MGRHSVGTGSVSEIIRPPTTVQSHLKPLLQPWFQLQKVVLLYTFWWARTNKKNLFNSKSEYMQTFTTAVVWGDAYIFFGLSDIFYVSPLSIASR